MHAIINDIGAFLSFKSQQNGLLFLAKGFEEIRRSEGAKINDAYASPSRSPSGGKSIKDVNFWDYSGFKPYYI